MGHFCDLWLAIEAADIQQWSTSLPWKSTVSSNFTPTHGFRQQFPKQKIQWVPSSVLYGELESGHCFDEVIQCCMMSAPSPSTASAVLVPGRLKTQGWGHHHHQCLGQQHLPDQSGHQWEWHGGHGSEDAGQGSTDQHQTQVGTTGLTLRSGCSFWASLGRNFYQSTWLGLLKHIVFLLMFVFPSPLWYKTLADCCGVFFYVVLTPYQGDNVSEKQGNLCRPCWGNRPRYLCLLVTGHV